MSDSEWELIADLVAPYWSPGTMGCTVRGTPTVTSLTRGYDAGRKISGRKVFGLVDTLGLLIRRVHAASVLRRAWCR